MKDMGKTNKKIKMNFCLLTLIFIVFAMGLVSPAKGETRNQKTENPMEDIKPTEITLYYPVQVDGALVALMDDLVKEFNQQTADVKVKAVYCGDYEQTLSKLYEAVALNESPDMIIMDTPNLLTLIDKDLLEPLDDYIYIQGGMDYINDFFPAFMQGAVQNGNIYYIPFQRSTLLMFYNKDHFIEAKLDPDYPPDTWEKLAAYGQQLTQKDEDYQVERWGVLIPTGSYNFAPLVISNSENGETITSKDGKKARFFTEESLASLQYLIDLTQVWQASPQKAVSINIASEAFVAGTASIALLSSGNLGNIHENANFDYGVSVLPRGKRYASVAGGGNIHILKVIPEENKVAAWKFIYWLTQPERQAQWNIDTGYIATRKSSFETTLMDNYYQEVPQGKAALNQLDTCYGDFFIYEANRLDHILTEYMEEALKGNMTAQEALSQAQREADETLEKYQ